MSIIYLQLRPRPRLSALVLRVTPLNWGFPQRAVFCIAGKDPSEKLCFDTQISIQNTGWYRYAKQLGLLHHIRQTEFRPKDLVRYAFYRMENLLVKSDGNVSDLNSIHMLYCKHRYGPCRNTYRLVHPSPLQLKDIFHGGGYINPKPWKFQGWCTWVLSSSLLLD